MFIHPLLLHAVAVALFFDMLYTFAVYLLQSATRHLSLYKCMLHVPQAGLFSVFLFVLAMVFFAVCAYIFLFAIEGGCHTHENPKDLL